MTAASGEEIARLVGDVDPQVLARIEAVGATVDEIQEALAADEDERGFGDAPHAPSSARVTEVRALLEELVDDEEDDEPLPG